MASGNLRPGKVVDERFVLTRRLGAGSSGVVWAAEDRAEGAEVALKILHPQLGREPGLVGQLAREARVLMALDHPHVARAIAFEGGGELVYLAMELIEGEPLNALLGRHTREGAPLSNHAVARLMVQICSGVAHAHAVGVVHRDLKPQNVLVRFAEGGRLDAKVVDFGIARLAQISLFDATTFGRRMGSMFYMSPEQTRGEPVDGRADVFALGSILFELLTLRRAWAWGPDGPLPAFAEPVGHSVENSVAAVFERISAAARPRPSALRPELPTSFDRIVARALAVAPEDRYPSVAAFANEARAALDVLTGERPAADTDEDEPTVSPDAPLSAERTVAEPDDRLLPADARDTDRRPAPVTPTRAFEAAEPVASDRAVGPTRSDLRPPEPKSLALPKEDLAGARTVGLDAPTALAGRAAPADGPRLEVPRTRPLPASASAAETRDTADLEAARARVAPTAFLDAPRAGPPPPGFASGLEEAGPTVREAQPSAAQVPRAPIDTQTTAEGAPRRRAGLTLGLVGGGLLVATLLLALVTRRAPEPAPEPPIEVEAPAAPPPRTVEVEAPRHPELVALLSKVKSDPMDDEAMQALVQGILQAADRLEDDEAREEIRKIAVLSSTVHNIEGLARCVARLEALTD